MCSVFVVIVTARWHVCDLLTQSEGDSVRDVAKELSTIPWMISSVEFASVRNRYLRRTEKKSRLFFCVEKMSRFFFRVEKKS